MNEQLDNPVWGALGTHQAHLGNACALARRYDPDVSPFAAVADETPSCYADLRQLLKVGEQVAVLCSTDPVDLLGPLLEPVLVGTVLQMVDSRVHIPQANQEALLLLGDADVDDMLDLVQRTRPGPFGRRTREMGCYIGIREAGCLVAMSGERMHVDGHVEISAVCVDDAWRGKGLAARLMNVLRRQIRARGETPFLHVFEQNRGAIDLYERLGFKTRRSFVLMRVAPRGLKVTGAASQ
jgi:predicted GNAT family acetyltransferase